MRPVRPTSSAVYASADFESVRPDDLRFIPGFRRSFDERRGQRLAVSVSSWTAEQYRNISRHILLSFHKWSKNRASVKDKTQASLAISRPYAIDMTRALILSPTAPAATAFIIAVGMNGSTQAVKATSSPLPVLSVKHIMPTA
jgi:hypothetical protein